MKTILLKSLSLVNFKGIRQLTIDFNDVCSSILGKNGIGKTTIFDAFTWLLFGKDSNSRKVFDVKTYDQNGVIIPKIAHEVRGVLVVDGETITLVRKLNEKWVRKRGTSEEVFTGNEEERYYNDVPMSVKEWNEAIDAICPEQIFKFITNPFHFTSQKMEVQRAMLFDMAGKISDEDVAKGNKDFESLLKNLTGKKMEEYKKEISSKKRRIKSELDSIPERIDERMRDMPESRNWAELEEERASKESELKAIESQLLDISKAYEASQQERLQKVKEMNAVKTELYNYEMELQSADLRAYHSRREEKQQFIDELAKLEARKRELSNLIKAKEEMIALCKDKREKLINEWKEINAQKISFSEDEFVCPTCHRHFEVEEIQAKQTELTERFNENKAKHLAENNKAGLNNKTTMEGLQNEIAKLNDELQNTIASIEEKQANPILKEEILMPDNSDTIKSDAKYIELQNKIIKLQDEANSEVKTTSDIELRQRKDELSKDIQTITFTLRTKETIDACNKRISELETMMQNQAEELAQLEGIEFTIQKFSKARVEAVEEKINSMFEHVKFKMFETQINGGEYETCEAVLDGVPYNMLNKAATYTVGLDIINTICKSKNICAPIFIDNCESVQNIIPTQGQQIRLYVSDNETITVK